MPIIYINGIPMNIWPIPKLSPMQNIAEDVEYEEIDEQTLTNTDNEKV